MRKLIREIKYWVFTVFIQIAIKFLPHDLKKTWKWISQMPIEDK